MRPVIVLVALFSVALAKNSLDIHIEEGEDLLKCLQQQTMSTLGKDLGEFMNFLGGIVTKEAEKKLSKELDKENRKLESKLQKTVHDAVEISRLCTSSGQKLDLFPAQKRCLVQTGAKFVFESGVALVNFTVEVAAILTRNFANFHGGNLLDALKLLDRVVFETKEGVKNSVQCFKPPTVEVFLDH